MVNITIKDCDNICAFIVYLIPISLHQIQSCSLFVLYTILFSRFTYEINILLSQTNIVHNIFHAPLSICSKDRFFIPSSRNCLQCKQTLCLCIIPYVKWNYSWKFWYGIDKKLFNQNCLPNQPAGIWTSIKMVNGIEVYYVKYLSEHNKLVIWLLYWNFLRI